jgi:hypothetical protein
MRIRRHPRRQCLKHMEDSLPALAEAAGAGTDEFSRPGRSTSCRTEAKRSHRFFAEITNKAIRHDVFHSVDDLVAAIEEYLRVTQRPPDPFVWTATAEQILAKVQRVRTKLNQLTSQT